MTTIAHITSGSIIAVLLSGASPSEYPLLITAIISSSLIDLDHIFFFIKDKSTRQPGKMHFARSPMHELVGFITIGIIMLILSFINSQLSILVGIPMMIHLSQDVIMGKSLPFNPFDKTIVKFIPQIKLIKILADILTIIISGALWISFLNGHL